MLRRGLCLKSKLIINIFLCYFIKQLALYKNYDIAIEFLVVVALPFQSCCALRLVSDYVLCKRAIHAIKGVEIQ